jgi:hypothetical protein
VAGLNSSHISFDFLPKKTFKSTQSPFIGIGLEMSSPRESSKTNFIVELWLRTLTVAGTYSYPFSAYTRHDTYHMKVNMIRLPVGIKYYLTNSAYIKGGGAFMVLQNNGSKIEEVYESNSGSTTFYEKFDKISVGQLSVWGGLGLEKRLSKRNKLQAEIQYEKGTGILRRTQSANTFGNATLLVGISF